MISTNNIRRYLFKAQWRSTALSFWIEAKDETLAYTKAKRRVLRMMGGAACTHITLVREENGIC